MAIETKIHTINLATSSDVPKEIEMKCKSHGDYGYRLAATFTQDDRLVLIFQKEEEQA